MNQLFGLFTQLLLVVVGVFNAYVLGKFYGAPIWVQVLIGAGLTAVVVFFKYLTEGRVRLYKAIRDVAQSRTEAHQFRLQRKKNAIQVRKESYDSLASYYQAQIKTEQKIFKDDPNLPRRIRKLKKEFLRESKRLKKM